MESSKMMSTKKLFSFLVTFLCLLFLFCFVVLFSIWLIWSKKVRKFDVEMNSRSYRFYSFNPGTNESNFGFLTSTKVIPDFKSFQDPSGTHWLVSPFGVSSADYKCTGSCSCKNERRNINLGLTTLSRSLIYLVSASSTIFAVHLAQQHFHETCEERFSDICPHDSIRSDVDSCLLAARSETGGDEDSENYATGQEVDFGETNPNGEYNCRGNCVPMTEYLYRRHFDELLKTGKTDVRIHAVLEDNIPLLLEFAENQDCDQYVLEKGIILEDYTPPQNDLENLENKKSAQFQFIKKEMFQFCSNTGTREMVLQNRIIGVGGTLQVNLPLCVGMRVENEESERLDAEMAKNAECTPADAISKLDIN